MQTLCLVLYNNQEECTHQILDHNGQIHVEDLQVYKIKIKKLLHTNQRKLLVLFSINVQPSGP